MAALITCENVSLGYEGKTVVSNIHFAVGQGDYLCIVGENGSGKSTLMRAMLGLQKPLQGKICLGEGLKRSEIGYLPQRSAHQADFPASVSEVVLSGCLNRKRLFYTKEDRRQALQNMERMEIVDLAKRCFRELSGGQQQRVLLARALCSAKKVLFLDEPTAGLDSKVTAELYEVIQDLHQNGLAVIMISHDLPSVVKEATHILHIDREPLFWGTVQDYLRTDIYHK
ncbi:MAG: metal ABC transporter ATP-binding protein [Clostridiales bacterium]|nr:metal ABC transporter ATP-binding protein [Clostridiales bacterium]